MLSNPRRPRTRHRRLAILEYGILGDRDLQQAQHISACNKENHFGMNQTKDVETEIDIIEVMIRTGQRLPATDLPLNSRMRISLLQVSQRREGCDFEHPPAHLLTFPARTI
jgi:hypothetical protein